MLSRIAQAQLGRAASRFARPAFTSPLVLRAAPVALVSSPWARSYAKNRGKPLNQSNPSSDASNSAKPADTTKEASAESSASSQNQQSNETAEDVSKDAKSTDPVEEAIPFHKLPDLTQGIPSTLEQEMNQRSGKAQPSALEAIEEEHESRGRSRDQEEYISTHERNRRWWLRFMVGFTGVGLLFGTAYLGRGWDDDEAERHTDIPNGWSPLLWWLRVKARMGESVSYYQEPAFEKLLPAPPEGFERPYTLVISLEDMLVHNEWSREHGWRIAKRPGMDYFIRYLTQYYELVLFTTVPFAMGEPLVRKLDPFHLIIWPLFREATKYEDGTIVKV